MVTTVDDDAGAVDPIHPHRPTNLGIEQVSTYLFAADRAAPRRKRASDVVQFVMMAAIFGFLAWTASNDPPIDDRVGAITADLPSWIRFFGWLGLTGSLVVMLVVLVVMTLRGGIGRGVLRDTALSLLLIAGVGLVASRLATGAWPDVFPEFDDDVRSAFPTLRTSIVLACVWVLTPYVTAPVQRLFRWTAVTAIVSPLMLGIATLTHLLGGIALAAGAVAAVRLVFGSPEGLPPLDRLADTLRRAGVEALRLDYRAEQPGTVGLATADAPGGGTYSIKIYGEDAARRQQAERTWRALWYRSPGPTAGAGRMEQAQNESLAMATCRIAGVHAPQLVAAGQDVGGDVVVVALDPPGRTLAELEPDDFDAALTSSLWNAVLDLHEDARVAHGRIAPDSIRVDHAGGVAFVDLHRASTMPTGRQRATDVASMLTTIAIAIGPDAAVEGALRTVIADRLDSAVPFLQEAAIDPALRRAAKRSGIKLSELRTRLAAELGIDEPELAPIRRVSTKSLVMIAFGVFAANVLISQIADVGLDTLREELGSASTGWLIAAFVLKLTGYTTSYISLRAVIPKPIPFAPTTLLQSAKSYVGLVVPSMVGRVGLDIRFLQKQGVSTTVAATQGPVLSLIGFIAEVTLLLLSAWALGQTLETGSLLDVDVGGLFLLGVVVVAAGLVVVLALPKVRRMVLPVAKDAFDTLRKIATSPTTVGQVYLGEMANRLFNALALGATVAAFGLHLPFAALVFVAVGTGLLAGLAPVPGGIGVAEATMTALLTAVGVDSATAVSISIAYRLMTAYLPPVFGFFSLNWLTKEGYL